MLAADRIDPLTLYASGLETSDYVERVAPLIRTTTGEIGSLLDVGAGGGQLGHVLRSPYHVWTAIEPAPSMQYRLRALVPSPVLITSEWRDAKPGPAGHDTVLAANLPIPPSDAPDLLAFCRRAARQRVVWVVAAQKGPRSVCLADCVPSEWHDLDETPMLDHVFDRLPVADHPRNLRRIDWSFRIDVPSIQVIAEYLADSFGWKAPDPRVPELRARLARQATTVPGGFRLVSNRTSAVLVW